MKIQPVILVIILAITIASCNNSTDKQVNQEQIQTEVNFQNKGHELVYDLSKKVGDYEMLLSKKDVVYNYTYTTPDGSTDQSLEKYIFEGELSYGKYTQHERTLPQIEGIIEQGYDGEGYWIKSDGKLIDDTVALKRVMFNRPTNFYWFTMFQKLTDPGLKYDYLGEKRIGDTEYDVVKISFELKNDKPTDIYQLYINKETGIVDQFLFTVADFGVLETPYLMVLEYEEIEGFLMPTKRKYKKSNWEAEVMDTPWVNVHWTNISFNNGLKKEDFSK